MFVRTSVGQNALDSMDSMHVFVCACVSVLVFCTLVDVCVRALVRTRALVLCVRSRRVSGYSTVRGAAAMAACQGLADSQKSVP